MLLLPPSHARPLLNVTFVVVGAAAAAELVQECEERVGDRFRRRNDKSDTLSSPDATASIPELTSGAAQRCKMGQMLAAL